MRIPKVKIFTFLACKCSRDDSSTGFPEINKAEETINNFIKDKPDAKVSMSTYIVTPNNTVGNNGVRVLYTIQYTEESNDSNTDSNENSATELLSAIRKISRLPQGGYLEREFAKHFPDAEYDDDDISWLYTHTPKEIITVANSINPSLISDEDTIFDTDLDWGDEVIDERNKSRTRKGIIRIIRTTSEGRLADVIWSNGQKEWVEISNLTKTSNNFKYLIDGLKPSDEDGWNCK